MIEKENEVVSEGLALHRIFFEGFDNPYIASAKCRYKKKAATSKVKDALLQHFGYRLVSEAKYELIEQEKKPAKEYKGTHTKNKNGISKG